MRFVGFTVDVTDHGSTIRALSITNSTYSRHDYAPRLDIILNADLLNDNFCRTSVGWGEKTKRKRSADLPFADQTRICAVLS